MPLKWFYLFICLVTFFKQYGNANTINLNGDQIESGTEKLYDPILLDNPSAVNVTNYDVKNNSTTTELIIPITETIATKGLPFPLSNNTKMELFMAKYNLTLTDEEFDYEEIELKPQFRQEFAKQIGVPSNPVGLLVSRIPCHCNAGVCGCCTGFLLSAFRTKGCMNITYIPEEFAFEVKMLMNDAVLYKNRLSGRNPRPICVTPPRIGIIEVCATFHDIYFIGRNMHVCLNMDANFQGYELFDRSFDCMRIGDQGVKIVKPEEGGGIPVNSGSNAEIDAGGDEDIEDYDENLIRRNL